MKELEEGTKPHPSSILTILFCTFAFILCALCSITPLHRVAGTPFLLHLPTSRPLEIWGVWLPSDLHLVRDAQVSHISSNYIEFLLLMALAFGAYGLCALLIWRQSPQGNFSGTLRLIWLGAIATGLIFVLTPAMLSHDIFVYAGYGRILVAHHANPYFVPLKAFPQDPFMPLDDWKGATAAYGPLWLDISALGALLSGDDPLRYILAYRLFGLAAHLLNIWLIYTTLRMMKCSPRTVTLGVLLYAWNPLALLESSLGGHNDVFLVTFILLGILLSVRAEQRSFTSPRGYLLPIVAFTLAALVKFTAAPLVAFFVVMLIRHSLPPTEANKGERKIRGDPAPPLYHWGHALIRVFLAGLISAVIALAFYVPFWVGHSVRDILRSFTSPPSANAAYSSILSAIQHSLPAHTSWAYLPLHLLSLHSVWNIINVATLLCALSIGAVCLWRTPTTHTLALTSLATLGALLVVTPWFFPWYVVWLVGLVPICLPFVYQRVSRGLLAFALTFSASALLFYFLNLSPPPIGGWSGLRCLSTIGPPLLAFFIFFFFKRRAEPLQSWE